MNMRMPGWYDIVRPRDTVRLLAYFLLIKLLYQLEVG
jgi:hypothetical protein